jgi:hypothetical protein
MAVIQSSADLVPLEDDFRPSSSWSNVSNYSLCGWYKCLIRNSRKAPETQHKLAAIVPCEEESERLLPIHTVLRDMEADPIATATPCKINQNENQDTKVQPLLQED